MKESETPQQNLDQLGPEPNRLDRLEERIEAMETKISESNAMVGRMNVLVEALLDKLKDFGVDPYDHTKG